MYSKYGWLSITSTEGGEVYMTPESRPYLDMVKLRKDRATEIGANSVCSCCTGDGDCGDDGHCEGRTSQQDQKNKPSRIIAVPKKS